MRIGFVGLGAMGLPMAQHLVAAGHEVAGFDLNPASLSTFAAGGGRAASSPADAAQGADLLVLMVVNADQAEQVLFEAGAADALAGDGAVILCSTCSPPRVEAMAARLALSQRGLVDAPVSGGVVGAQNAGLTVMASAPDPLYARTESVLRTMGSRLFRVGDTPGQGAMVKTINQLLCGVHIATAAEALSLAERAGLDLPQLLEIFGESAAASWMLNNRGPRMAADDGKVTSAVDIFVKDLGIVLEAGRGAKAPTPLAALAQQLFLAASAQGLGRADDSQVIEAYRAMTSRRG
ncbi:MAG: NAD(P)-dependent oxidoreductase [Pseudomonadota bacterium]